MANVEVKPPVRTTNFDFTNWVLMLRIDRRIGFRHNTLLRQPTRSANVFLSDEEIETALTFAEGLILKQKWEFAGTMEGGSIRVYLASKEEGHALVYNQLELTVLLPLRTYLKSVYNFDEPDSVVAILLYVHPEHRKEQMRSIRDMLTSIQRDPYEFDDGNLWKNDPPVSYRRATTLTSPHAYGMQQAPARDYQPQPVTKNRTQMSMVPGGETRNPTRAQQYPQQDYNDYQQPTLAKDRTQLSMAPYQQQQQYPPQQQYPQQDYRYNDNQPAAVPYQNTRQNTFQDPYVPADQPKPAQAAAAKPKAAAAGKKANAAANKPGAAAPPAKDGKGKEADSVVCSVM